MASNYLNVLLAGLVTIFVVPIYLRLLGHSEWGVLAFCLTAHGAMLSLDAFIGQLLQKDVARAATSAERLMLWQKYQRRYWVIVLSALGTLLTICLVLGFESFAQQWDRSLFGVVVLVGLLALWFAFQFANNANLGTWFGMQMHGAANGRSAWYFLLKHTLALVALTWIYTQTWVYLGIFASITVVEYLANRRAIRLAVDGPQTALSTHHDMPAVPAPAQAVHWYVVATVLALCSGQLDRVVLSFALTASDYGRYFLVSSMWLSMLSLLPPIQRTFLPLIVQQPMALQPLVAMWRPCLLLVVLPCATLAVFAETVLLLWLGDAAIARQGAATLRIGLLGVIGIALYAPIGSWLFVQQRYRKLMQLNGLILTIQLMALFWLYPLLGGQAGAWCWVVCGGIQLALAVATVLQVWSGTPRGPGS